MVPDWLLIIWGTVASVGMIGASLWMAYSQPRKDDSDE